MEPSYRVRLKIGELFFATWIPRVAHLKGWFVGYTKKDIIRLLLDYSKKADV